MQVQSSELPFRHVVVDNFLPLEILSVVLGEFSSEGTDEKFEQHPSGYQFASCIKRSVLKHWFSRQGVYGIGKYFNSKVTMSKHYQLPQFYRFDGPKSGIPIHNDAQTGRDFAFILYLSGEWEPQNGGRLHLHDSQKNVARTIDPLFNRLVAFEISPFSYHSVEPIGANYVRKTLIGDLARVTESF